MAQVLLLARAPRRLRIIEGIRAALDDTGHTLAEAGADIREALAAALVLGGIVQERPDGLVLVAAIVDHGRCHREEVPGVRNRRALADLAAMHVYGVGQGRLEAGT